MCGYQPKFTISARSINLVYTNANEVADRLGVSEKTVRRAISSLKEKCLIERDGSDKNGMWIIRI